MQCKNCGEFVANGVNTCPRCGQPVEAETTMPGMATASAPAPGFNDQAAAQPYAAAPEPAAGFNTQPAAQPYAGAPAPQQPQPAPLYGAAPPQPGQPGFVPPPPMYPPVYPSPVPPAYQAQQNSIAPLILGIVGILGGFWVPLIGIVCGIIGTSLGAKDKRYRKSMATAGLIVSIIAICVGGLMWFANCVFLLA